MNCRLVPPLLALLISSTFPAVLTGEDPVELRREGDHIDVLIGGRPFATYYFDPAVAKPYLFPLRSARGTVVTRGFPMVTDIPGEDHDEPHQRALYFAHGDINGFDFWGEAAFPRWSRHSRATFGRTVFRKLDEMSGGTELGSLRAQFDLQTSDGQVIAEETQAFNFRGDADSRIIDCEFTIRASNTPVKIGDTKEGTFAIRLAKALESPSVRMRKRFGVSRLIGWITRGLWTVKTSASLSSITRRTFAIQLIGTPATTACWRPILSGRESSLMTGTRTGATLFPPEVYSCFAIGF